MGQFTSRFRGTAHTEPGFGRLRGSMAVLAAAVAVAVLADRALATRRKTVTAAA